jgi:uracil-DNA glycosylase
MPLWKNLSFFKSNYYHTIIELARHDPSSVTPMRALWYNAMYQTPLEEVRCVILGQDPYPTRGHACGLAFSVFPNVSPLPPSLRNIFIEYSSDLGYPKPPNGSLLHWARNGVFLWNTVLTTEVGKPRAHHDWGWQRLTTEVIQKISIRS